MMRCNAPLTTKTDSYTTTKPGEILREAFWTQMNFGDLIVCDSFEG